MIHFETAGPVQYEVTYKVKIEPENKRTANVVNNSQLGLRTGDSTLVDS